MRQPGARGGGDYEGVRGVGGGCAGLQDTRHLSAPSISPINNTSLTKTSGKGFPTSGRRTGREHTCACANYPQPASPCESLKLSLLRQNTPQNLLINEKSVGKTKKKNKNYLYKGLAQVQQLVVLDILGLRYGIRYQPSFSLGVVYQHLSIVLEIIYSLLN